MTRQRARPIGLLLSGAVIIAVALTACGGVGPRSMSAEVLGLAGDSPQDALGLAEDDQVSPPGDNINDEAPPLELSSGRLTVVPPGCQALVYRFVCRGAQLQGHDFRGYGFVRADFSGADLTGARFDNAELWHADFSEASMSGASFEGADLWRAVFTGADARNSNFRGANLAQGWFSRVNARGADFTGANLEVSELVNTDFSEATWIDGQPCEETYGYYALRCYRLSDHAGDDYRSLIDEG